MIYDLKGFGQEILKIRNDMNMRQKDVQKKYGVNSDTLRRLENGLSTPKFDTLDSLSIAYKRDIHLLLRKFSLIPSEMMAQALAELNPHIRNKDYDSVIRIFNTMRDKFTEKHFRVYPELNRELDLFLLYMNVLYTHENNRNDITRKDVSSLIGKMGYSLNQISPDNKNLHLNILEIRVFVLLGIIYRLYGEHDNSELMLSIALRELKSKHHFRNDYFYYFTNISANLLMTYHIRDRHSMIHELSKQVIEEFDLRIGIIHFSSVLTRIGVSNHFLKTSIDKEYLTVAVDILRVAGYEDRADIVEKNLYRLYDFYNLSKKKTT